MRLPKVSLGSVALSLYSAMGLCVLLLTGALWNEGHDALSLYNSIHTGYDYLTIEKSARISIVSIIIFFIILVNTWLFEKRVSLLMDKQKTETRLPFTGAVINTVLTFVCYVIIVYAAIGIWFFHGSSLISYFAVAGLVGLSTYLHLTLPRWENRKISKRRGASEIEALKLEYDWCWKVINGIYWSTILILASVWFFWFNQYAIIVIPVSEWGSFAAAEITGAIALQMIYIGLGLWFGILGKLIGFSRRIPDQIVTGKS